MSARHLSQCATRPQTMTVSHVSDRRSSSTSNPHPRHGPLPPTHIHRRPDDVAACRTDPSPARGHHRQPMAPHRPHHLSPPVKPPLNSTTVTPLPPASPTACQPPSAPAVPLPPTSRLRSSPRPSEARISYIVSEQKSPPTR